MKQTHKAYNNDKNNALLSWCADIYGYRLLWICLWLCGMNRWLVWLLIILWLLCWCIGWRLGTICILLLRLLWWLLCVWWNLSVRNWFTYTNTYTTHTDRSIESTKTHRVFWDTPPVAETRAFVDTLPCWMIGYAGGCGCCWYCCRCIYSSCDTNVVDMMDSETRTNARTLGSVLGYCKSSESTKMNRTRKSKLDGEPNYHRTHSTIQHKKHKWE